MVMESLIVAKVMVSATSPSQPFEQFDGASF